jgi:hypothetical protein
MNLSFFRFLATSRTRFSACDTLSRCCARRVLCRPAFPSASALRSTNSAASCPALFIGFLFTTTESDSSRPCIIGYGSSPSRRGPLRAHSRWSGARPPGSRARTVCTCQGLRPRRAFRALALAHPTVLPSAILTASAPGTSLLSRLNGWAVHSPVDASRQPSRIAAHDSGPMRFATPSSQRTSTV